MPPPMWTKVNIDGSSHGNPGVAGCGGIFRNCRGFSRGSFDMPVGNNTNFVAEACAFIKAVELAKIKKWFPLQVETDSMAMYNKVRTW